MFQTNLVASFATGATRIYPDLHPDQSFEIKNETLTFESMSGDKIWYIPTKYLIDYYTECVRA